MKGPADYSCGPGKHAWGEWVQGRAWWRRTCEECNQVDRESRNEQVMSALDEGAGESARPPSDRLPRALGVEPTVIVEPPPPDAVSPGRGHPQSPLRRTMDSNPGQWVRWAEGIRSGPATASKLRQGGYQARYKLMPDRTFTVWARHPPLK
jgi:hypothetical protein